MTLTRCAVLVFIIMGLFAALSCGTASAQDGEQIMIVVTTDDNGELNACG